MIITDSNLNTATNCFLPNADFAYRLQLEAIKKQGNRSDTAELETSLPRGWKLESAHKVDEHNAVKLLSPLFSRIKVFSYLFPFVIIIG